MTSDLGKELEVPCCVGSDPRERVHGYMLSWRLVVSDPGWDSDRSSVAT